MTTDKPTYAPHILVNLRHVDGGRAIMLTESERSELMTLGLIYISSAPSHGMHSNMYAVSYAGRLAILGGES